MGVPKFYRWISERYPCLSQVVHEHQIPDFDNLYLDMNGIIHQCSHPNDDDPHFRITEEQIFVDIFHYIEVLFRIIKPKKVFFMAIDGVAPRAKMNQQRGRRFRSAKEAEDNIRRALQKGQVLPKEERFDSNCITPGTLFMVKLHEQLKYFVNDKVSNDPAWQGLRIYLSGHETPGEGEHKIMDFIRSERSRSDHDPNTRHCLYGLDADLMILGLSSHEPHFSLLREEVKFGKSAKRMNKPEKITFHLLHLSLFREYIDWEFAALKETLPFPYDLARIIDDWILMGFLVGNDFIPHLPQLHINHDALPYLYKTYIDLMPFMDGYLSHNGKLDLARFERYMQALAKFDTDKFSEEFVDMKWFEKKLTHRPPNRRAPSGLANGGMDIGLGAFAVLSEDSNDTSGLSPELQRLSAKLDEEDGEDEDDDTFEIEFKMHKRNYYQEKMGFTAVDSDLLLELSYQYVLGIQWILLYYFNGVPSWSWYYPYHYAPYMSDIKGFSARDLVFDMGQPFKPFEQLLAVLPAASKKLLPAPFQSLMIMEHSPIIEYYPVNFKTDLNGKQQDWEAVVLIPFIDEKRLLEAMEPIYARLSPSEIERNIHSSCLLYTYDSTLNFMYLSSLPGSFPDISCCHARCEKIPRDAFLVDAEKLTRGLCDGVRLDVYFPGFPTLYHIRHTAKLDRVSVKVFSFHSKGESMVLAIEPRPEKEAIRVAEELLGETCYVGWPHLVEALVHSVSDETYKYTLDKNKAKLENGQKSIEHVFLPEKEHKERRKQISSLTDHYLERKGVRIGETKILIEACTIRGKRFVCGPKGKVTLNKEWSPFPVAYPLQLTVKDIHVHEAESTKIETIEELFPLGSKCFMLASPHYGACGEILEVDPSQGRVRLQLSIPVEPDMQAVIQQQQELSLNYMPSHIMAKKLGITSNLLSRITSKVYIERGSSTKMEGGDKVDIGLNLKNSKQNKEILGFARRTDDGWTYSPKAHNTVAEYLRRFPHVFEALAKSGATDRFFEADLSPGDTNGSSTLSEVQDWLKTLPARKMEPVMCGSEALDEPVVKAIEEAVQAAKENLKQNNKKVKVRVRPYVLFRPSTHLGNISPDNDADFQLFDRVVNVNMNSPVPFELRGTVIGIHQDEEESKMLEVAFDEEFLGGQPLRCSSKKVHLMRPSSLINLSFGQREEDKKKGRVTPARKPTQSAWGSPGNTMHLNSDLGASPDLSRNAKNGPRGSPSGFPSPVNQSRSSPQSSGGNHRGSEGRNDKHKRPQKQMKTENSTEFANMWKDLKKKETGTPEARPEKPKAILQKKDRPQSGTKANEADGRETVGGKFNNAAPAKESVEESTRRLRELLHIGENRPATSGASESAAALEKQNANSTPGRKLTVDELFRSQETSPRPPLAAMLPFPNPPGGLPSQLLANWCLGTGLPPPNFYCTQRFEGLTAVVQVGRFQFTGAECCSRPEAIESASSVALLQLQQASQVSRGRGRLAGVVPGPFPRGPLPGQIPAHVHPRLQSPDHFIRGHHHPSHPNTGKSPNRENLSQGVGEPRIRSATPAKSQSSVGLSAGASPFVPLQVTRRNTPLKKHSNSTPEATRNQEEGTDLTTETKKPESTKAEKADETDVKSSGLQPSQSTSISSSEQPEQDLLSNAGNAKPPEPAVTTSSSRLPAKKPPKKRLLAPSFFNN